MIRHTLTLLSLICAPTFVLAAPPSYDRVNASRLACERMAKCGCPEAQCHENLLKADRLPVASFRCVAAMECGVLCEPPAPGQKAKAVTQCFDPKKWSALKKQYPDAPPISPERHATIVSACTHAAECGCAEEECVLNLRAASRLPLASFSCLAGQPCAALCAAAPEFQDTPNYKTCFDPKRWPALQASEKGKSIAGYCEKLSTCGCPEAACVETFTQNTTAFGQDLFVCLNGLGCDAVCEPKALQMGSKGHLACIKPIMSRMQSQQALDLARARSRHNTNMSIIRAIGGSGRSARIYDANGNYLRTESR